MALAAYWSSFSGTFVLDDTTSILGNPTIRHLWPVGPVLSPPAHSGVGGRPLINLSYAINYALGGTTAWGYHAFNLAVHIFAGLTLYGLVRRTLLRPALSPRFGNVAMPLAFAVAVLWVLHPLQTSAVTYVAQRAESLMGLLYLLTLYCFVRSQESGLRNQEKRSGLPVLRGLGEGGWPLASILSCALGMATKEVMVTAPLVVLLYDRTFVAGTFKEAWRRHRRLYVGMAVCWILLGLLLAGVSQRGVGFGHGVSWWVYALTECRVIVQYLGLAIWPHPLVFDYGMNVVQGAAEAAPYALIVAGLAAATVWGLCRRPVLGFIGAWVFIILAPTSSVVPVVGQPMAENRMYLPLAALIMLAVAGLYTLVGRRSLPVFVLLAVVFGLLTARRNADYQSQLSIWGDTVAKCPGNARAHDSLGNALLDAGQVKDAIREYTVALGLAPDDPREHYNLGRGLAVAGQLDEAMVRYEEALKLSPDYVDARNNFGVVLAEAGRPEEAIEQYETVLKVEPDNAEAYYNLGRAYEQMNRLPQAIEQYGKALQLNPDGVDIHDNLGTALAQLGRFPEAIANYGEALRLDPGYAAAHNNLGLVLMKTGRAADAVEHFQEALRLKPGFADAHRNLADVYLQGGRTAEAIAEYQSALQLKPDDAVAQTRLGIALFETGNITEAMNHYQRAVEISPDYAVAHYWLANTLAQMNEMPRAIDEFEEALRLAPDYAEAHNNLGMVLMQAGRLKEAIAHFAEAVRLEPDYAKAADNLAEARAALEAQNGHD
ncbi:MAG TPA: tetratricopeptide repeat protein [Opitutaceae bacterium]|nr:tetratricopeptide repeat protein [Opitutaceae bacterium]